MSYFKNFIIIFIISLQFLFISVIKAQETNSGFENNSKFVNQFFPSEMDTGKKYTVWISFKNTGKSVWSSENLSKDEQFKLSFVNEESGGTNKTFGDFSNVLLRKNINPGETAAIEFEITAPAVPGNYESQWRMMKGDEFFGDASEKVTVNVSGNTKIEKTVGNAETLTSDEDIKENIPFSSSVFEKQTIAKLMKCSFKSAISVTMTNNGNTVWKADSFYLIPVDDKLQPMSSHPLGIGNIKLSKDVDPGASVTFKFQIIAPSQPGNYILQFGMAENGKVFGNPSDLVKVSVMK